LADFRRFPLEVHSAELLLESAWVIARETGLTVYDSLYVALAVAQTAPLVTADRRLFEALRGGARTAACVWVEEMTTNEEDETNGWRRGARTATPVTDRLRAEKLTEDGSPSFQYPASPLLESGLPIPERHIVAPARY
jgi:hypothetical protein